MRINAYGERHPEVANALNELGCLLTAQENYKDALAKHITAYDIKRAFFGDSHPELGKILMDMGIAYRSVIGHLKIRHLWALQNPPGVWSILGVRRLVVNKIFAPPRILLS